MFYFKRKNVFVGIIILLFVTINNLLAIEIKANQAELDPDGKTAWYDLQLFGVDGKGWTDTESYYDRLPQTANGVVRKPVWRLSHNSAGMNVRFWTDADSLIITWLLIDSSLAMPHFPATGVSGIDLYAKNRAGDWLFLKNGRPTALRNSVKVKLNGAAEYMLYLPLYNGVESLKIGIPKDSRIKRIAYPTTQLAVIYGTSITQGGCASRPGMAYTSILSRTLDVPIINLGFSGNGKMEPEMADVLAELNPSVFVLDCLWNMTPEMVAARVDTFVSILRASHPHTPILLVEDANYMNKTPTEKGVILRRIYSDLQKKLVPNIYFLSNDGMLGYDGEATVDGVHPTDLGMLRIASHLTPVLRMILSRSQAK